jgi:hypothetical protein
MPLQPVQRWLHPVAIASSALVLGWISCSAASDGRWRRTGQLRGERRPPFDKEVIAVALDGSGQLVRLAHHYSHPYTFRNEPHANISPHGPKVIFASNWSVDGPTSAYVVDIGRHR